ncbi:MAG: leucyl aminopeptidase [Tunicatimonas sp.]
MSAKIKLAKAPKEAANTVVLLTADSDAEQYTRSEAEQQYVAQKLKHASTELLVVNQYDRLLVLVPPVVDKQGTALDEAYRKLGVKLFNLAKQERIATWQLQSDDQEPSTLLNLCEGLLLSAYSFNKYKATPKKDDQAPFVLKAVSVTHPHLKKSHLSELQNVVEATFLARDLVNEPVITLNAEQLSRVFKKVGKASKFKVEVLDKAKIKSLKMGGLLSVNAGSTDPPTFSVLEYKPSKPINKRPYVLVGKGVTYDTGGLSLKPSTSMDTMKSDMGGAAAVIGALQAVATNQLPVHLVGLIPATDNRPSGNAIVPGDVITISDGTTVEVLNTDAEGRLILADALAFAKKYDPELVIDLATLTGAAAVAVGKEGIVMMGTADKAQKEALLNAGEQSYERLVEFPLWDEYRDYLKSDIADLKNIGGRMAGAITAGMFLKHFTDYPWIHLDIAGVAFLDSADGYRGKNGTGAGVRLLYQFFRNLTSS